MEIRFVTEDDDLFEISNIYESSWKYAYQNMIPQHYLDSIPMGMWVDRLKQQERNNLILVENGKLIGAASYEKARWEQYCDYGEIMSIYLLPNYINKGYGKKLFIACVENLLKSRFDKIMLWVLEDNFKAREFYRKNGFICSEIYKDDNIGGKNLKEVLYVFK
ncbi:GNAT family N-acetyltransferase [[Clostridium] spiroforme]|nr:GNAT family N-acetyltransferase [Thomasclavelia spiroformis]MBM6879540.1 GNAT family N-acetyltransferase [Thomasclavelia spiroformis]